MVDRDRFLRAFARLLPREFRERVFEPALADIRLDESTLRRPFARAILVVECVRLGVPQHVWRRGRPTIAAVALVVALALSAFVVVRLRYAAEWKADAVHSARP